MKIVAMAACLLLTLSAAILLTPTIIPPSSAFGQALKQLREARSMSYSQLMTIEGQSRPNRSKNFISEDGRRRTELQGVGASGGSTTISDANGYTRIHLLKNPKTALVYPARKDHGHPVGTEFLKWLETLKKLGDKPDRELGVKELDNRRVTGFVATQGDLTFTMWVDNATRELARMEYDFRVNGKLAHIVMSDFRFNEPLDESLFSFDVPTGYTVHQQLTAITSKQRKEAPAGLELAWSHKGAWVHVASATGPTLLLAADYSGKIVRINETGNELGTTKSDDGAQFVHAAHLAGDKACGFLRFNIWGAVKAYSADGKVLWGYEKAPGGGDQWGVNDLLAADLNGDGIDEVIVGYSGSTGLHVLDHTGKLLWKTTAVGNVWHVAAGNMDKDARPAVITTSADGKVHLFSAQGKPLRTLDPGFYANMVRTWQPAADSKSVPLIVVAGIAKQKTMVAAITPQGETRWSLELPAQVGNAVTCRQKPWLALTVADGSVRVINLLSGKEMAQVGDEGGLADVAWLPLNDGDPMLIVATQVELQAYRVTAANR